MDCEKFDQHVIDALYDELDELTFAALRRHVEGCGRCAGVWAGLRATREVGILPIEEPPDDLEARILEAATLAQRGSPWHKKVLRGLAWAGSHAMRPQLAMAALFFLVIGSSLLLLRARPGTVSPVSVTERGSPSPEPADLAAPRTLAQAASSPTPSPAPTATASPVLATSEASALASADGRFRAPAGAPGDLEKPADTKTKGSADDARTALAAARAVRDTAGCSAAVPKLDAVAVAFSGTQPAADAMWDEASCYKQMGDAQKAQQIYLALRSTGYRDRAERELAVTDNNNNLQNQARAAGPPPAAVAAAPAAPAPPPAYKKADDADASDRGGGAAGGGKAMKRPAAGATNPRAPAAPAPRAADHNSLYGR